MSLKTRTVYPIGTFLIPEPDDYFTNTGGGKTPQVPDPDGYTWGSGFECWVKSEFITKMQGYNLTSHTVTTTVLGDGTFQSDRTWPSEELAADWISFANANGLVATSIA